MEEIELRRHIERVAELRRALPPGGAVTKNYAFEGEGGQGDPVRSVRRQADARHLQLHVRPATRAALPDVHLVHEHMGGKLPDVEQRIAFVFVARSPIARLIAAKKARGWTQHRSTRTHRAISRATTSARPMRDLPGYNVFTRRDGTIRHFWSGEMRDHRPPIPDRTRAARRTSIRCGPFWTPRPRAAVRTGTRGSAT